MSQQITLRTLCLAFLITFALAAPVQAQMAQPRQAQADFSETTLEKAAHAYVEIQNIYAKTQKELEGVADAAKAQKIQQKADSRMTSAVEDHGLDLQTYQNVISAAGSDEAMRGKFLQKVQEVH